MNNWFLVLPFISAIIGWFIHWLGITIFFEYILPKKLTVIAQKIGKLAATEMFSLNDLEEKLVGEDNMKKLMPVIEKHIDEFLRHKLSKALPIISMFIGEKTINQLKEIFMKELEVIFPATMKTYLGNLEKELNIEKIIAGRIVAIPPRKIKDSIRRELIQIQLFGTLAGLAIGIVQLLLTRMID